jgi:hypothetical protein
MDKEKRFEGLGTKIDPAMYEVLNACCDALQVDVYHLLQWFAYTIIRAAAPWHELDPRIQKVLTMLESDVGWQKAFNIANPSGLEVAQIILILQQEGRKGLGAVMIDKPYCGEARQTECVDDILETVTSVTMRGIYRRLRRIGAKMNCEQLSDVLLTMIDAQTMMDLDDSFRAEMPGLGDYTDAGQRVAFGKKTKAKKYRTVNAEQSRIVFDDNDREVADYEVKDWEGEHAQHDEPPADLSDHD